MPVPQELWEMFISPLKRTFAMSQGIHSLADWRTQPGTSYFQLPITNCYGRRIDCRFSGVYSSVVCGI
ncbi:MULTISPECIES: hypothetical protein [unclassified Microcoleus]|uniref:hypothetical protein n=1 Tax=unclassified Microcoleus TaxID=2642155 RepID=UPI002FD78690